MTVPKIYENAGTQYPSLNRSSGSSTWSGLLAYRKIRKMADTAAAAATDKNNGVTIVEINDDNNKGHENKGFENDDSLGDTSGTGSRSSTSESPEPPLNFELKDMSPSTKPKQVILPISTTAVSADQLDSTAKSAAVLSDDHLISVNEHHKKGRRYKPF